MCSFAATLEQRTDDRDKREVKKKLGKHWQITVCCSKSSVYRFISYSLLLCLKRAEMQLLSGRIIGTM